MIILQSGRLQYLFDTIMKIKLVLLLGILAVSCAPYKREKFSYEQNEKQVWIDSYKYEAFYGCMKEGIGNDSLRMLLSDTDLFNKSTDITFALADNARARGKEIVRKMPNTIIKVEKGEEHLKNKKFISYNCLIYYASEELDVIAKAEYKKYISSLKD